MSIQAETPSRIIARSRSRRPATNPFDWAFGPVVRELVDEEQALRLVTDEFKTKASPKGYWFATTRNQPDRLAHAADRSYAVWRRTPTGPTLQRLVARGFCGQWIVRARRADWSRDETRCQRCLDALAALIKDADEREAEQA